MKSISFFSYSVLLVAAGIFFGCKKSSNTSAPSTSNTTSPSYTLDAQGNPSGTYNGLLFVYTDVGIGTANTAFAEFFSAPTSAINFYPAPTFSVNSVSLNGVLFSYNSSPAQYSDSTYTLNFPPAKWVVNGANTTPSFTYTNNNPVPTYTAQALLPNTITRSQNLAISITGTTNYDQVQVQIQDINGKYIIQSFANTSSTVTVSKDSLNKLAAGANGQIMIMFAKFNPQTLGGKNFLFATAKYYTKNGVALN